MRTTGPYNLSLANPLDIAVPNGFPDRVVLSNPSPYACAVTVDGPAQWLQPYSADLYLVPQGAQLTVTPSFVMAAGGGGPALLTASWYQPDENLNGVYPATLTQGVTQTSGAQLELTGSPHAFTGTPASATFGLPANSPTVDGLLIVPYPKGFAGYIGGLITVTGATTGAIYQQQTAINTTPIICDFSSSADPDGATINYTHSGGGGTGTQLRIIGLNRSQIVRPVHGALAEGPTTVAHARSTSGGVAALFQVPANGQYRLWALQLSGWSNAAASAETAAAIQLNGVNIAIVELGTPGATGQTSLSLEGGLPIAGLVTLGVQAPASGVVEGVAFYSVDA